jgi:hypothetical protein
VARVNAASRPTWVFPLLVSVVLFLGVGHGHSVSGHVSLLEEPSLIAGTALVLCSLLIRLLRASGSAARPAQQRVADPSMTVVATPPSPMVREGARASPAWLQRFLS